MRRRLMSNDVIDPDWWKNYLTIEVLGDNLTLTLADVSGEDGVFKYNKNGTGWKDIKVPLDDSYSETLTFNSGDIVALKANRKVDLGYAKCNIVGANFNLKGNALSIIYGDNAADYNVIPEDGLSSFFSYCTTLLNVSEDFLPVTKVEPSGCYGLFMGCSALITAPALPATTLGNNCYYYMFSNCYALTEVPSLPATIISDYCYYKMFAGCKSLKTAPSLPATTLKSRCYQGMFQDCTSLTSAPALKATSLATQCYDSMFRGCSALKAAPSLPATKMKTACYQYMFLGCTSLTTAPDLPATTLDTQCYGGMFLSCKKLNSIKALFTTTPGENYTYRWLEGVASSGTFYKSSSATWDVTGTSGIPSGWTVSTV